MPLLVSGSLLKRRTCALLSRRHVDAVGLDDQKYWLCTDSGLSGRPRTTPTKSGRIEGRQADTTAIDGSAAVHKQMGRKSTAERYH